MKHFVNPPSQVQQPFDTHSWFIRSSPLKYCYFTAQISKGPLVLWVSSCTVSNLQRSANGSTRGIPLKDPQPGGDPFFDSRRNQL
jgi:hypothetical protein